MSIMRLITTALLVLGTAIQARAEFIDERTPVQQSGKASAKAPDAATATSTAVVAAVAMPTPQQSWDIQLKDINFATVFHRWAHKAGYRVRWDAQKHFLVEAPDNVAGTFEDAVNAVLESPGIAQSAYPLEVCIYPNTPPLARITRKGEQDKECK
jgi:hypothetical protein